ncbi:MAG TPA: lipid A biosynthesis acyltransferase [Pseudomonadota bacterium]|nr:lipid A biosynthesis acyltransferase [Pseudomonadota bacterium]
MPVSIVVSELSAAPLKVRVAAASMRLASYLPLSWLHGIGAGIGRLAALLKTREWRVTRRNHELVGAALGAAGRDAFVRDVLVDTGRNLTELAKVWGATPQRALALVRHVHGREHFDAARAQGRGVIVAAPHLGCWELLNLWLCAQGPMALLYRVPQHAEWETLLRDARGKLGAVQVRADAAGVRELLRCLKQGMTLGILPDQRAKGGEGEFAPFFGLPCKSMTLLSRLAEKTDAPVVFGFARRLPRGEGFDLHFLPAEPGIASTDRVAAVGALHRGIEACVRLAPTQYQWTYKRYSAQPGVEGDQVYGRG